MASYNDELERRVRTSSNSRIGQAAALVAAGALMSSPAMVYTCDKTLSLTTNGNICDDHRCVDVNMYSMPIQTGSTICFNTIEGEKVEIVVKDSKLVTRYQAMYYACDFDVKTIDTYECKGATGNCWNGGMCKAGVAHPLLKENSTYPTGYGCISESVGCDTWCWHQVACTWYRWVAAPIADRCHITYSKTSEIWQTGIFIRYKGSVRHIKLNTNNPSYNLNGFDLEGVKNLPLAITSFTHETLHLRNSIVVTGAGSYEVDASQVDMPVKNTVGEYQVSLDKSTVVMYTSDLRCESHSCKVSCSYDTPAMNRVQSNPLRAIPKDQIFVQGKYVIKRLIPIQATANLIFGSIELKNLYVTPSYCKIRVEQSYACTACNTKPSAVFIAYDIRHEGLIEFESNCTWVKKTLSCNPEPYTLELEHDAKVCTIILPTTNQTITVNFNFVFMGELTMLRTYRSESAVEAIESLAKNPNFWGSLLGTVNFMAFASLSTALVVKLVRLGIIYKTEKDVSKA